MTNSTAHNSEPHLPHPKYRPDIDGLRAIAILLVVGFHSFPNWIKGGFIGVDIFFVISGYLISIIIVGSLERNSFSFAEFYTRRINRIFPALLLVLITCFVFGWLVLFPEEYKHLGKHIAGGAGFVSNFVLWNESGYFDNVAETKPLLHLWSMGIEEQFYIAWPLILWFAWKQRLNLLTITIVVVLISFALNLYKVCSDTVAAFYSPQTRFWELMTGSVLACLTLHRPNPFPKFKYWLDRWLGQTILAPALKANGTMVRNVQSMLGATLITIGALVITNERVFPGWWAVLPTIGAVLIISAGAQAWLNHVVLSNRVFVWFGLISFPLYLWHWPLLSFVRILEGEIPLREIRIATVVVSIVLAWLTYRLIEMPIRFNTNRKKTIALFILMVVVGFVGYSHYKYDGIKSRAVLSNEGDVGQSAFFKHMSQYFYACTPKSIQKIAFSGDGYFACRQSKNSVPKKIVIIGDSHAEHLFIGLAEELTKTNVMYWTGNSIPYESNKEFKNIFKYVIDNKDITTVILSAAWSRRLGLGVAATNLDREDIDRKSRLDIFKNELLNTVTKLTAANKKVYLVDDVPNFSFDAPYCKYSRRFFNRSACDEESVIFNRQYRYYYPILQSVAGLNKNVKILNTATYFCKGVVCSMKRNGFVLYRDENHLNIEGSRYLGRQIMANNKELAE